MKNKIIALLLILVLGVACTEDFLETDSTQFISAKRMEEVGPYNPGTFDGLVRGIYSLMIQTGTGGTDLDHDDFGQKGFDIYLDLLSSDMVLAGYNYSWYEDIAKMASTIDYTDTDNYKPWRYYYRIIYAANSVIDGLGGNDATLETEEEEWQMGQAKALRGHSYFYLASMFAKSYDQSADILPIYTSLDQEAQPLSSAAEVWKQIKDDLEKSVELLDGFDRGSEMHSINADVANGLLAYTYYGADWMWGFDLTLDQGLDLVSWWGQVDLFTYSYSWAGDPKSMDVGLYNSINASDVRKKQFLDPWDEGILYPLNKFYAEGRSIGGQREVTSDYVYMRVEEMYLIKAEAEAFNNQDAAAIETLKMLLAERIGPSIVPDPENEDEQIKITAEENLQYIDNLSGQALKDEIYKQWRIEMWGEGKSYLAMKRNKATIVREGHIDYDGVPIPYNDERLTFEIPKQEIQDNPFISH